MASPVADLMHPHGKKDQRKRMIVLGVVVLAGFLWWRRQQSGASSGDPSLIASADPAAAAQPAGDGGSAGSGPDSATAAALEGLGSGLTDLQTQLANDEANYQSLTDSFAQTQQELNDLYSLSSAGYTDPSYDTGAAAATAAQGIAAAAQGLTAPVQPRSTTTHSLPTTSRLPHVTVKKKTSTLVPLTAARAQSLVHAVNPATASPAKVQAAIASVNPATASPAKLQAALKSIVIPTKLHL